MLGVVGVLAILLLATPVQPLGIPSDLDFVEYIAIINGKFINDTLWSTGSSPCTIDDALIDQTAKGTVEVTLGENRFVRSTEITSGNDLIIENDATFVLGPPTRSPAGSFVDIDGVVKNCPANTIQPRVNKAFCTSCLPLRRIPDPSRTRCIPCPAGKVFPVNGTGCVNCPQFFSSDGLGSDCFPCPFGFSSVAGGPCVACVAPTQFAHLAGPCVGCLPDLRPLDCPKSVVGTCSNRGTCTVNGTLYLHGKNEYGAFAPRNRTVCQCNAGWQGSACLVPNPVSGGFVLTSYDRGSTDTIRIVLPFPHGDTRVKKSLNTILPVGPTIEIGPGVLPQSKVNIATRLLRASDIASMGFVDPTTTAPAGFTTEPFNYQILAWDATSNVPVQGLMAPYIIKVPYDHLKIKNPWRLELYYYNEVMQDGVTPGWAQIRRHCNGRNPSFNKKRAHVPFFSFGKKTVDPNAGTVNFEAFNINAQIALFDANEGTAIPGMDQALLANGQITPNAGTGLINTFNGQARPPQTTTGITGVLPVPPPADPGSRPGSPRTRKPVVDVSAASVTSISALLVALTALLAMLM